MGYTYDKSRASKERVWSSLQAPASAVAKDLLSDPTGLNKITDMMNMFTSLDYLDASANFFGALYQISLLLESAMNSLG